MIKQLLLLLFIIFLIIIFIALFVRLAFPIEQDIKEYTITKSGNGKGMNMCPPGCLRGSCHKINNPIKDACKYNFQCQYCQDKTTNNFYVSSNMDQEKEILPIYEEQQHLTISQKDLLNDAIKENNQYIIDINKKIMDMNK